jgi:2-polyprenyl-6-hydroxyphenyl methylase/3-demethylubiquinone-9 3-methyltransferase
VDRHFAFGKNWASFADSLDSDQIDEAEKALRNLLSGASLRGRRFLDIGCGSGLHALAALRLGAAEVVAIDVDADSVATARAVLSRYAAASNWRVEHVDVLEIDPARFGTFDVVYSWGVLHHTGSMYPALRHAASMLSPQGRFLFALYRRTWLCSVWKIEKKWYSQASPRAQGIAQFIYTRGFALALLLKGTRLRRYAEEYARRRGMSFQHDVHDWLGGYPYESIAPHEVDTLMSDLGLVVHSRTVQNSALQRLGVFGSGCDEYHYKKRS